MRLSTFSALRRDLEQEEYGIFKWTPKWITQGILEVAKCIIQDFVENKNAKHRVFYIEEANFKMHGILEESESL